jgi:hypothetical protein
MGGARGFAWDAWARKAGGWRLARRAMQSMLSLNLARGWAHFKDEHRRVARMSVLSLTARKLLRRLRLRPAWTKLDAHVTRRRNAPELRKLCRGHAKLGRALCCFRTWRGHASKLNGRSKLDVWREALSAKWGAN